MQLRRVFQLHATTATAATAAGRHAQLRQRAAAPIAGAACGALSGRRAHRPVCGTEACGATAEARAAHHARRMPFLERLNPVQLAAATGAPAAPAAAAPSGAARVLRVLAGPGSGKTRVLSSRAAFLVASGAARAEDILCITFTNRAAREMRERMLAIGGEMGAPGAGRANANAMEEVACGTFHSICLRLLRSYAHTLPGLGLRKNFTVYDSDDAVVLMKAIIDGGGDDAASDGGDDGAASDDATARDGVAAPQGEEAATADRLLSTISLSRNLLASSYNRPGSALAAVLRENDIGVPPHFERHYDAYARMKRRLNVVDFDDLLHMAVAVMKLGTVVVDGRGVSVLRVLQDRWRHVLVDEFQDTNRAQYNFIHELMTGGGNGARRSNALFVVGDADQSIFGWRGANMENLSRALTRDFSGSDVVTYKLETNYRSSAAIVAAARAILPSFLRRAPGDGDGATAYGASEMRLVSHAGNVGEPVKLFAAASDQHEGEVVAREIVDLVSLRGLRWADVAVLYRTRVQARALEEACIKHEVPYELISGTPFFNRREIRDLIAYLRIVNNLSDDLALARVINVPPRGIGAKTVEKLRAWSAGAGAPLGVLLGFEAMMGEGEDGGAEEPGDGDGLGASVVRDNSLPAAAELGVSAKAHQAVVHFSGALRRLQQVAAAESAADVLEAVIREVGYWEYLKNNFSAKKSAKKYSKAVRRAIDDRIANVQELLGIARQAGGVDLPTFLENVSMIGYGSEGDGSVDMADIAAAVAGARAGEGGEADRVRLMTIHQSKGLEFDAVFLTGFEKGIIPLQKSDEGEERRLVYVAMTRAKRHLYITRSTWRSVWGKRVYMKESPFASSLLMAREELESNRQYHEDEWVEL